MVRTELELELIRVADITGDGLKCYFTLLVPGNGGVLMIMLCLFVCLKIYLSYMKIRIGEIGADREKFSIHWFTAQMSAMTRAELV